MQAATHHAFLSLTNCDFSYSFHCLPRKEPEDVGYLPASFSPCTSKAAFRSVINVERGHHKEMSGSLEIYTLTLVQSNVHSGS